MPFILAHASAKPLSRLTQILSRPQNQELALGSGLAEILGNSGLEEIFRSFVGFFVFCFGKLLLTASVLAANCMAMPNYKEKPFSIYSILGVLFLPTLGLHFFLAYQEFVFYSFCSYYQTFSKRVMESSGDQPTLTRPKTAEQNQIVRYNPPERKTLHNNLEELIEIMKNMIETFGPFLLQNFSLMLLFWILHIYYICFVVIQVVRTPNVLTYGPGLASFCVQLTGGILIVR